MEQREPLALLGLERALRDDISGEVRDRWTRELEQYAVHVRRELFAGALPERYRELEKLRDSLERAQRLVKAVWKCYHPELER